MDPPAETAGAGPDERTRPGRAGFVPYPAGPVHAKERLVEAGRAEQCRN
nr:hypothetical protein RVX_1767 [Nitratidesulfovibrio sp. HK-II]